ncbi:MAG: hypothetical protein H6531_07675 [Actinobacteria bacterium]|nr:hypothetical protein [Actinomycetota bacterium]
MGRIPLLTARQEVEPLSSSSSAIADAKRKMVEGTCASWSRSPRTTAIRAWRSWISSREGIAGPVRSRGSSITARAQARPAT